MFHVEHHQINSQKVSRETFSLVDGVIEKNREQLTTYLDRLLWWNKKVNLVSRDVSRETVWEHIRHSLILTEFQVFNDAESIVDSGTGGGLPGIPLAISAPEKKFLLNDIVSKKIIAVRQILLNLSLTNAQAKGTTVEKLEFPTPSLLISKHAFKVNELWTMVKNKSWNAIVFYKGVDFKGELEGIDEPLDIRIFDLSGGGDFYEGKAIVVVKRIS